MLTGTLYGYQDEAVDLCVQRGSALIAYEMGLGKTIVAIAAVEEMLGNGWIDMCFLVVPAGLKYQWAQAIAQFTDVDVYGLQLKDEVIAVPVHDHCMIVDGPPAKRQQQYDFIWDNRPDYVILSYETLVNDWGDIRHLGPQAVVLDEATAIKSFKAKRSKRVKAMHVPYRIALTGTPIENRPEELYSIMEWVDPDVLGRFDIFDRAYIVRNHFGGVVRYRNLDVLHDKIAPVMARKTALDPDVAPYMPEVAHKEVYVGMSASAKALYKQVSAELVADLRDGGQQATFDLAAYYRGESMDFGAQGKVMSKVLALQMLCNHPDLLHASALAYEASWAADHTGPPKGSAYAYQLAQEGRLEDLSGSEKFEAVVEDIANLLDTNPSNKIIVFSFFKGMLALLQDRLAEYDSVIYSGDLTNKAKAAAKARFQNRSECRLFLSSDAGGYGVDLPQANYLINYDLPWSAGKMDQRNGRHKRAGSEHKRVFVLNYLVESSVEERVFSMLALKRKVAGAILDGKGADRKGRIANDVDTLTAYLVEAAEGEGYALTA